MLEDSAWKIKEDSGLALPPNYIKLDPVEDHFKGIGLVPIARDFDVDFMDPKNPFEEDANKQIFLYDPKNGTTPYSLEYKINSDSFLNDPMREKPLPYKTYIRSVAMHHPSKRYTDHEYFHPGGKIYFQNFDKNEPLPPSYLYDDLDHEQWEEDLKRAKEIQESYPYAGRRLLTWIRQNLPGPYGADFENKKLEQKAKGLGLMANSKWRFADSKMYRQHTDGPPAATTTFEIAPQIDDPEDDEQIINGKKWKMVRPKDNPQPSYLDKTPAAMKNSKKYTHLDANGNSCSCGFTSHLNLDKTSKWKIAGPKLDWIKERGDKALQTEEGQQVLDYLEKNVSEKADPLIPWIVREYKKKRLVPHFYKSITADGTGRTDLIGFYTPGTDLLLEGAELDHWADWFNDKKSPTRRGVDIMQLDATQMKQKIDEWDVELASKMDQETIDQDKGKVIYQFEDPPGWTMRLVAAEECGEEGELMGHCVGGYSSDVARGNIFILSLRDQNNRPHATIEARPDGEIVQIQGKQNEEPIDEYKELIADFFEYGFEKFFDVKPVGRAKEIHDIGELKRVENGYDEYGDEGDPYGYYHVINPESYGLEQSTKIDYRSILRNIAYLESDEYDDFVYGGYGLENPVNTSHRGEAEFIYNVAKSRGEIPLLADAYVIDKENGSLDKHFKELEKILPNYGDLKSRQKFEEATGTKPHEWDYDEQDLDKILEQHKQREDYDSAWNDWIRQNYLNPKISWPEFRTMDTNDYHLRQVERSGIADAYQKFRPYATMHSLEHLLGQHMYNKGSTQSNMPEGYGHDIIHPLEQENPKDVSPYARLKHPDFSEQLAEKLLVDAPNREQDFIHPDQQQLFNPDRLTPIEASIKRLKTRIANEYEQDAQSVVQLGHQLHSVRGMIGKFLTGPIEILIKDTFTLIDQTIINNNLDYISAIKEKIEDIQTEIYKLKKDAEIELIKSSNIIKEAPARSKAQYRYMQGICNGSIEPPEGMTRAKACEYVKGQDDYKELPEKASKWKIAGETKTKLLERASMLPEDTSDIIHQFDDGWTIRRLNTIGDAHREGQLMSNCIDPYHEYCPWSSMAEDELVSRDPGLEEELGDQWQFPWNDFFYESLSGLRDSNDTNSLYSLRDPDNIPHGTYDSYVFGGQNDEILGRHNYPLKPEYKKYWDEWLASTGQRPHSWRSSSSRWKIAKEQVWEIILDGTEGYDIIGTGSFEECRKKTEEWLKDFIGGHINYNTEDDAYPIPKDAKEQDKIALAELEKAEDTGRWSFYFDYDKPFDLIIQPFKNKKEGVSKMWKTAKPNLVPPEAVRSAARRGIKYHAEGKAGDGFQDATLDRAHKIANGEELTPEHVRRMHSFFERHAGGRSKDAGNKVTPWDVAWLAWGGNAGRTWARQKDAELDRWEKGQKKNSKDCGCWDGYCRVPGTTPCEPGSCEKCDAARKQSKWKVSAREPYKPVIKPNLSPLEPGQKLTIPEWWARKWEWRQLDRAYKQRQKEYKQERKQKEKQQAQEQQQQVQDLMSGKQSKWKIADYQGWTNWETWNTNLMMQNEYDLYKHFHNLAATGASLNQFVADAIGLIVGPYNQQLQKDFSEISDDEEVEMKKEHQKEEWWTKAEQAHPDDYLAQEEFVRKMEELTYSLMGEPEPTDIANHWLDESKINWQEIYNGWKGNAEAEGNQVMSKWKKISATPFVMQVLEMHDNKYSVDQIAKTLNTSPREVKRIIQSDLRQRPYEGLDISQQYEKALMHKDEQKIKEIENKIWEESDRYNSYDESTDRLKLLQEAMKRNDRGKEHELMKQFWSERGMGDEYEQDVMNIKQPTQQELNTWMQEELNKIPKQ